MKARRRLAPVVAACALLAALTPLPATGQDAASGELHLIGEMPTSSTSINIPQLLIDPAFDLGYTIGGIEGEGNKLLVYDLEAMRLAETHDNPFGLDTASVALATVDRTNHRILFPSSSRNIAGAGCPTGPTDVTALAVFDIPTRSWSRVRLPCTSGDQFFAFGISFHGPSQKLYALGAPFAEVGARALNAQLNLVPGRTLLLRQVDAATGSLDWEVNLRDVGCQNVENADSAALVVRHGDDVVSYCYGFRNSPEGAQGFAVRIPLRRNAPMIEDGRPVIRTTPALPNTLFPLVDPGSGRLLLLTAGPANGNAVWVFDPPNDRFYGVIASGGRAEENPSASVYVGLNPETGRTYLLTSRGILVADARSDPLPAGLSYPVVTDLENRARGRYIAVAPTLGRLFVPLDAERYLVLSDDVPQPPEPSPPDPDRGTQDIPEQEGKTRSVFLGGGSAYGVHLLNTGGVTRAVNNVDPLCYTFLSAFATDDRGRCASEQVFTSGNREMFLSAARAEVGSEVGAAADATGGESSSKDTATDTDFRRIGSCFAGDGAERTGSEPPSFYEEACAQGPLSAFRSGTRGEDGEGFPVAGAHCDEFGEGASSEERSPRAIGPASTVGASRVTCDGSEELAEAWASGAMLQVPDARDPVLSVGRAWSEITSERTSEGIETTVRAVATGVQLGDFEIGRVETVATTTAHGRTGTTDVSFTREITEVRGPGYACENCDEREVVDVMNTALGQRVRVDLPPAHTLASPKGFQAIVVKDPRERASDRALNDDDTFEVPGLEVVLYNDGETGRSRGVIHLAGVQADSRYGIFLLPEVSGGTEVAGAISSTDVQTPSDMTGLASTGPEGPGLVVTPKNENLLTKTVKFPARAVADAIRLIVHNPREFGLLFLLWSLLAAPVYLFVRRRAFAEEVGR